jgi:dienelactone hydrolase
MGDALFDTDPDAPLDLWTREMPRPERLASGTALRFEYTSQGDRVPGQLLLPDSDGPAPLVLLQHGANGSKSADYLEATGLPWVERGAAVASIDFPLHGERLDAKLALATLEGDAGGLRTTFVRQAVVDLRRVLDALVGLPELDASRIGYVGFSMGSMLGAAFCAVDPRPRAAVFALGGAGLGPARLDPARYVGQIAPRPVLFVNTSGDQTIPRRSAEAFHAAAAEPKEILWFEGSHTQLPGVALKAMWTFLARQLSV